MTSNYAVIILNYNNTELIINQVNSLLDIDKKINIVIVDNNSNDENKNRLKEIFNKENNIYKIFNKKNTGYASGNNLGFEFIEENLKHVEYVFIMNPDVEIENKDIFKNLINELANDENLATITPLTIYNNQIKFPNDFGWKMLTFKNLVLNGTILGKYIKFNNRYKLLTLNGNIAYIDIVQGCFFAIKMEVAKRIGYFDSNTFLYGEEVILAKKINSIGLKQAVYINNYIKHNHNEKNKRLLKIENRIFDLKCFYNSRKYIIKKYSGKSNFMICIGCSFLNIDFFIKKILITIVYCFK